MTSLTCAIACLALTIGPSVGQELVSGPVPGKYALEPAALFSTAIVAGDYAYLSGVPGSLNATIEDQVVEIFEDFNMTLSSLGASLDNAVRATVYLSNMSLFSRMNAVYATMYDGLPPARTTIQAPNPRGSQIEIDLITYIPGGAASS